MPANHSITNVLSPNYTIWRKYENSIFLKLLKYYLVLFMPLVNLLVI